MLAAKNLEKRAQIIELYPDSAPKTFKCEKCRKLLSPIKLTINDSLIVDGLYRNSCPSCKTVNYYKIHINK